MSWYRKEQSPNEDYSHSLHLTTVPADPFHHPVPVRTNSSSKRESREFLDLCKQL
ncbi:hypothetical protein DSO57_1033617 [Entomophthora muscae]|uniref:Uncharacterized protein n=1 Tax=Entomophthora muscae TaxID=34485 RepID=A0ACC2RR00_9FUNG|nr:hypothetical protein DSO57_1033617 [Entomophthora muscae]